MNDTMMLFRSHCLKYYYYKKNYTDSKWHSFTFYGPYGKHNSEIS